MRIGSRIAKEIAALEDYKQHSWVGDFTPGQVGWLEKIYQRVLG